MEIQIGFPIQLFGRDKLDPCLSPAGSRRYGSQAMIRMANPDIFLTTARPIRFIPETQSVRWQTRRMAEVSWKSNQPPARTWRSRIVIRRTAAASRAMAWSETSSVQKSAELATTIPSFDAAATSTFSMPRPNT